MVCEVENKSLKTWFEFVFKNINKIDWENLSENPNAIPILERNMEKIKWKSFS